MSRLNALFGGSISALLVLASVGASVVVNSPSGFTAEGELKGAEWSARGEHAGVEEHAGVNSTSSATTYGGPEKVFSKTTSDKIYGVADRRRLHGKVSFFCNPS